MDKNDKIVLRNVMVMALVDGELTDEEKQHIDALRVRLGVDADEFKQLCAEFRNDPNSITLPRDADKARAALKLMVEMAAADGQISSAEHYLLQRLADRLGVDTGQIDDLIDEALGQSRADNAKIEADLDDVYRSFGSWDAPARREKIQAVAGLGRPAVVPLLKVLESYRTPDGASDAIELKTLVARALGDLGDPRAIYYLAQQVNIGDADDDVSNAALRFACAEAIGKIMHQPFGPDQDGVTEAREWWRSEDARKHDRLAL